MANLRKSLVLSSSGSRLFVELGVLKKLYEKGFSPHEIVGCSGGSLIGACLAAGKSIEETESYFFKQNPLKLLDVKINSLGLIDGTKIVNSVLSFIGVKNFSELKMPLKVVATNINSGNAVIFSKGSLFDALRASIAVPGIFHPVILDDAVLVDGAVSNPLPINLVNKSNLVLAIDVSFYNRKITSKSKTYDLLNQIIFLNQNKIVKREVSDFPKDNFIYCRPEVSDYGMFEYKKERFLEMIFLGEAEAKKLVRKRIFKKFI
ncbi:patatin-like phospholipase family protein [Candidatus Woesearchaeota archaeon]|nr:patatin-like phospholipase family protein [Candidatus Woesearchaeota archaeon]